MNVSSQNRGVFILSQTIQRQLQVNTIFGCLWVPHCLHSFTHTAFCSSATRTQPFVQLTHLVDLKYLKYSMISEHVDRVFFPNSGIWNPPNPSEPASPGVILILLKSARRYSSEDFAFLSQLVAESNGRWFVFAWKRCGMLLGHPPSLSQPDAHMNTYIYI